MIIFDKILTHKEINKLPARHIEIVKTEDYTPKISPLDYTEKWEQEFLYYTEKEQSLSPESNSHELEALGVVGGE